MSIYSIMFSSCIPSSKTILVYQRHNACCHTLTIMFLQKGCRRSPRLHSGRSGSFFVKFLSPDTQETETQQGPAQCGRHGWHSLNHMKFQCHCVFSITKNCIHFIKISVTHRWQQSLRSQTTCPGVFLKLCVTQVKRVRVCERM